MEGPKVYALWETHFNQIFRCLLFQEYLILCLFFLTIQLCPCSLEKIRPEKELERAKSEILRCKLRIRDSIYHLDSLLSEGRPDENLFDNDEIDYENVCAIHECYSTAIFWKRIWSHESYYFLAFFYLTADNLCNMWLKGSINWQWHHPVWWELRSRFSPKVFESTIANSWK